MFKHLILLLTILVLSACGSDDTDPVTPVGDFTPDGSFNGDGYALVNVNTFDLELVTKTRGVDDAFMAHIHTGVAGQNGPVLVPLMLAEGAVDTWLTPADLQINADILSVLAGGGHYVNVHTPANPSGEIRGQIE